MERGRLIGLTSTLVALVILHDLDHVRQGRAIAQELYGVGAVALVTAVAALALAVRNHPLAGVAAAAVGFGQVVGLPLVHIVPDWGPISDPYPAANVDGLSWGVIALMMAVGLALGIAGLAAGRRPGRA